MNENRAERNDEIEIDFQRIFGAVWHRIWIIVLVALLCAAITFGITFYLVTPLYESSAMFYVNNNSLSVGDTSFSISSSDITASKSLVDSYIIILTTRETLNDVIDYAGVQRSYVEVRDMISAAPVNETEIFEIVVTSPDPQEAEDIADAIAYILPKRITSIIEGTSAKIVDSAVIPVRPSSPSYMQNTLVGFLAGMVLAIAVIILREIFAVTIRTEEDVQRGCKYPILASVPNMAVASRGGYYYYGSYGSRSRKDTEKKSGEKEPTVMAGSKISFSAAEAYKLLRTKLQFSFADEENCRVIGVSSALAGEGKSLTSINLAYSLSQLGKRVLLIDCDMRRPSLNVKLPIEKIPGLSNYLSGVFSIQELVQNCGLEGEEDAFSVVSSGRNPPNPIELLSSDKMKKMLQKCKEQYDYVILDLPPVAEVSDAMTVSQNTDGILLVVRQDHGNHVDLAAAVREFEFVGAKILGVVFNCAHDVNNGYGRYYRKYYGRYYGRGYRHE